MSNTKTKETQPLYTAYQLEMAYIDGFKHRGKDFDLNNYTPAIIDNGGIQKILALEGNKEPTPGPWELLETPDCYQIMAQTLDNKDFTKHIANVQEEGDAYFIANAPSLFSKI